jgi:hypothetical protein
VAIVYDAIKGSGWIPPHHSAVFHTYASADTPWVLQTLSHYTPVKRDKVSSNSVMHDATQFVGPHEIPYGPVQNSNSLTGARRSIP